MLAPCTLDVMVTLQVHGSYGVVLGGGGGQGSGFKPPGENFTDINI